MAPPYKSPSPEAARQALVKLRERHKERPDPSSGRGELSWDDGATALQSTVEVLNINDYGARVLAQQSIVGGVRVDLTRKDFRCAATVRYCKSDGQGFVVGLRFSRPPQFNDALDGG